MLEFLVLLQSRLQLPHTKGHVRDMLRQVARRERGTRKIGVHRTRTLFRYGTLIEIGHEGDQTTRFGIMRCRLGS